MIREEPCPRCLGTGYVYLYPPSSNLISPCDFCKGNKKILRMIEEPPSLSEQVIDLRKRIEKIERWPVDNRKAPCGCTVDGRTLCQVHADQIRATRTFQETRKLTVNDLIALWRGRAAGAFVLETSDAYRRAANELVEALSQ